MLEEILNNKLDNLSANLIEVQKDLDVCYRGFKNINSDDERHEMIQFLLTVQNNMLKNREEIDKTLKQLKLVIEVEQVENANDYVKALSEEDVQLLREAFYTPSHQNDTQSEVFDSSITR